MATLITASRLSRIWTQVPPSIHEINPGCREEVVVEDEEGEEALVVEEVLVEGLRSRQWV